jgi:hypothetical protein
VGRARAGIRNPNRFQPLRDNEARPTCCDTLAPRQLDRQQGPQVSGRGALLHSCATPTWSPARTASFWPRRTPPLLQIVGWPSVPSKRKRPIETEKSG